MLTSWQCEPRVSPVCTAQESARATASDMQLCTSVPAVQHECIPQAILGMDVLCQAKSGMGKTAVFVLSVLQQLEPVENEVAAIIICHTRELAYQVLLEPTVAV